MYLHRASLGPVDLAFTDRFGGVSGVPYAELNLARDGADDPQDRARNLQLLMADFAEDDVLVDLEQVHGAGVVTADPAGFAQAPTADGVVTAAVGVSLLVRAADCVPVLLADPVAGIVGAAHCGRPGLVAGVVTATVARLRELGADRLTAWIGPYVCGGCYEVPADLQAEVLAQVPAAAATTRWGTPALDIGAGVRDQLAAADVEVHDLAVCTRESDRLFSYRRDQGQAGRHAGIIRLRR